VSEKGRVESFIYILTAVVTVIWSVWLYLWWEERAGLSEETPVRFALIIAPSSYFLLIAVSGWYTLPDFRLDLVSLLLLDAVTLVCAAVLGILVAIAGINARRLYVRTVFTYNLIAILLVSAVYIVRHSPGLIVRLAAIAGQWSRIDFFSFSWLGSAHSRQPDLLGILNKIFIALLSYIPVSVIRYASQIRHRKRLERELAMLKMRVGELEQTLTDQRQGVVK
jgi:hypothetical protein